MAGAIDQMNGTLLLLVGHFSPSRTKNDLLKGLQSMVCARPTIDQVPAIIITTDIDASFGRHLQSAIPLSDLVQHVSRHRANARQSHLHKALFYCFAARFLMRLVPLPNAEKRVAYVSDMCYIFFGLGTLLTA